MHHPSPGNGRKRVGCAASFRHVDGGAPWRPQMTGSADASIPAVIDVRTLVPMQRHQKIFELVDKLAPGNGFVLVNDHDPKPLYYQLEAEHPQQFSWTYLESGPEVWRVEIARRVKAA
jgi:uncharacterized protein (DUF2249 family)